MPPYDAMRYYRPFPAAIPQIWADCSRVTHPSATDVLLRPFDLHVLSTPPAFILSQNQTLEFNCLKSSLSLSLRDNGSNDFVIFFCWLASKLCSVLSHASSAFDTTALLSLKLTEIFFFVVCLSKISHFFLILFLICFSNGLPARRRLPFVRQPDYNTTSLIPLSTVFSYFF